VSRRTAACLLLVLAVGCASAGGVGYFVRAGWSEARILMARRPIADLLARDDTDPGLRERLALTLAVREFAAERLGLRVGDSYTTFAEVDGEATVWVLSAARRDRLAAHTWWYPLVGRVPYRGFFARDGAEKAGRRLAAQGLDVEVRSAVAFSTLGWFADPLLSTAADGTITEVAETLIHELFHATLYVPGKAAFNESAATFAGHRGAVAFFCGGPGAHAAACADARREWARTRARGRVLARFADRLRRLYASGTADAARERIRARLAERAAATLVRRGIGSRSELVPPNNARLLGKLLYLTELDAFERLAPTDASLGPALAALIAEARGASDPFAALAALATRPEERYSTGACSRPGGPRPASRHASPSTACSGVSPAGCVCSDTTSPTARTSADAAWSPAPAARGASS
jgi:predicted aminopeptidase